MTATTPPPGAGEPGPTWKRLVVGHDIPCGLGPGGGIPSGLRGSEPPGMPVGGIGRYVPPAPATSLPWVSAAVPAPDGAGPGAVEPPPPPVALALASGSRLVSATARHSQRTRRVTDRTTPAAVPADPGSCRPRPRTRGLRGRGRCGRCPA